MPAKKRCQFQDGEEKCPTAALRIVGLCNLCQSQFCGQHRMPEQHRCSHMSDCRQEAHEKNAAKLKSEQLVTSKMAAVA